MISCPPPLSKTPFAWQRTDQTNVCTELADRAWKRSSQACLVPCPNLTREDAELAVKRSWGRGGGISRLLFLQRKMLNQKGGDSCPLHPRIFILRQLVPNGTDYRITRRHLLKNKDAGRFSLGDSRRSLGICWADLSCEFRTIRGLGCSRKPAVRQVAALSKDSSFKYEQIIKFSLS